MSSPRARAARSRVSSGGSPELLPDPWVARLDHTALRIHVSPPWGRRLGAPAIFAGPLLLSATAVLVHLLPGAARLLEYDRAAILRGELWRLLTGHWTHLSLDHLALDVAAFAALGGALVWVGRRLFWRTVLGSALAISLSLLVCGQEWSTYRGLSGIDSALLGALATLLWLGGGRRGERRLGAAALLLFAGKIGYESITGTALFAAETPGHEVVPLAHLVGAGIGAAVVLLWGRLRPRSRERAGRTSAGE